MVTCARILSDNGRGFKLTTAVSMIPFVSVPCGRPVVGVGTEELLRGGCWQDFGHTT